MNIFCWVRDDMCYYCRYLFWYKIRIVDIFLSFWGFDKILPDADCHAWWIPNGLSPKRRQTMQWCQKFCTHYWQGFLHHKLKKLQDFSRTFFIIQDQKYKPPVDFHRNNTFITMHRSQAPGNINWKLFCSEKGVLKHKLNKVLSG